MVDSVKTAQAEDELEQSYDTSDPKQVNDSRKKSARTRADRLEFVKAAMGTPQGRSWYYDILVFCKVFNSPYISGDPYSTTFNCGQQNIGLRVLDDIQTAAPEQYINMIRENKTKQG